MSTSSGYPHRKKSKAKSPGGKLLAKWLKASPIKRRKR